jgi:hypothetical protein
MPKVIDAHDIMTTPSTLRQLCVESGLDPDALQYEGEEFHDDRPKWKMFTARMNASTGNIKGLDARNLNIEAGKVKWIAEWVTDEGERLAKFVEDTIVRTWVCTHHAKQPKRNV